eukprot:scaffold3446_cov393-Prasinococcus_capsulatus_cf.AAC.4
MQTHEFETEYAPARPCRPPYVRAIHALATRPLRPLCLPFAAGIRQGCQMMTAARGQTQSLAYEVLHRIRIFIACNTYSTVKRQASAGGVVLGRRRGETFVAIDIRQEQYRRQDRDQRPASPYQTAKAA